jgi:hypothetical protein
MSDYHPTTTLVYTQVKDFSNIGDPITDPLMYHNLDGGLQYLTLTQPNITYVVQQVFLRMRDSNEPHLTLIKCILRYVNGTLVFGLQFHASSMTTLTYYFDTNWAGCPDSRCSTYDLCVYLGDIIISWSFKIHNDCVSV